MNLNPFKPIVNAVKRRTFNEVENKQITKIVADLQDLRTAQNDSQNRLYPNRDELYAIYSDVINDSQVKAVTESLRHSILGQNFNLVNSEGVVDEKATEYLQGEWFEDFLSHSFDAFLYGNSLIIFGERTEQGFKEVDVVDRRVINPYSMKLRAKGTYHYDIDFTKGKWKSWSLFVGGETLGLFEPLSFLYIWKKNALIGWGKRGEKFGMPFISAKTSHTDTEMLDELEAQLSTLGMEGWGIFDDQTEIELKESMINGAVNVYSDFVKYLDKGISKVLTGQTMMFDDGASKSQGEVHQELFETFVKSYLRQLKRIINTELLPFMAMHGMRVEGLKFEWDFSKELSFEQRLSAIKILAPQYNISAEEIEKHTGVKVEEKEQETNPVASLVKKNFTSIQNMYKGL